MEQTRAGLPVLYPYIIFPFRKTFVFLTDVTLNVCNLTVATNGRFSRAFE